MCGVFGWSKNKMLLGNFYFPCMSFMHCSISIFSFQTLCPLILLGQFRNNYGTFMLFRGHSTPCFFKPHGFVKEMKEYNTNTPLFLLWALKQPAVVNTLFLSPQCIATKDMWQCLISPTSHTAVVRVCSKMSCGFSYWYLKFKWNSWDTCYLAWQTQVFQRTPVWPDGWNWPYIDGLNLKTTVQ